MSFVHSAMEFKIAKVTDAHPVYTVTDFTSELINLSV